LVPPTKEVSCQDVREASEIVSAAVNRFKEQGLIVQAEVRPLCLHLISCGDCRTVFPTLAKNYTGLP